MVDQVPMDMVQLQFEVENWISSETAEVTVNISASTAGDDGVNLREEITDSLEELVKGVDWRFVNVDRSVNQSGMEEWAIQAQARVVEDNLNDINNQAKDLGRAGLQFRVGFVDFTPTKEQYEELNASLRQRLYKMATEELKRLNSEVSGRRWRVATVHFGGGAGHARAQRGPMAMPAAQNMIMASGAIEGVGYDGDDLAAGGSQGFSGFEVSEKVIMTANVSFQSVVHGFESMPTQAVKPAV